jgi:hypothetical protein
MRIVGVRAVSGRIFAGGRDAFLLSTEGPAGAVLAACHGILQLLSAILGIWEAGDSDLCAGVVQRPCDESVMLLIIRDQQTLQVATVTACTAGVHPREPYVSSLCYRN